MNIFLVFLFLLSVYETDFVLQSSRLKASHEITSDDEYSTDLEENAMSISQAVAATDVMTDRLCLRSNGTNTTRYSAADLLSCCEYCLVPGYGETKPCENGGKHELAWTYWKDKGIVSGHYNKTGRMGCRNYHVHPYDHDLSKVGNENTIKCTVSTMSCPSVKDKGEPTCNQEEQECDGPWTGRPYKEDRMKAEACYYMERKFKDEAAIKLEILLNGPVHAIMTLYEDFFTEFTPNNANSHKVEPYFHKNEEPYCGGHSIRIVGWGKTANNKSYWIAANTYGDKWGDHGFFHLDFTHDQGPGPHKGKQYVYAGIPAL